jgi:hypothetical protein
MNIFEISKSKSKTKEEYYKELMEYFKAQEIIFNNEKMEEENELSRLISDIEKRNSNEQQ